MQRNINHEHNVEFPQLEAAKESIKADEKFYIGLGIGLVLGYVLKSRSTTEVIIIEK
jgi:hypothetical protein